MQCAKGGRCKGSHPLICEDHGCAFDTMNTQAPTADAIRLAVKLSGHGACEQCFSDYPPGYIEGLPCAGCLGDAATIDRELLLPEKHVALMAAQAVVDANSKSGPYAKPSAVVADLAGPIDELREALSRIKTPAMPHLQPTSTPLAPWPPKTQ